MCNLKSFKHTHRADYFLAVTVTPSDFQLTERLQSLNWVAALVLIRLFAFYNLGRRKFPCLLSLSTGDRSLPWSQRSHAHSWGCMCMTAEYRGECVKVDTCQCWKVLRETESQELQEVHDGTADNKCLFESVVDKRKEATRLMKHQPLHQSAGLKAGKWNLESGETHNTAATNASK